MLLAGSSHTFRSNGPLFGEICLTGFCPIFNSNNPFLVITKLGHNVYGHDISAKFDNQLDSQIVQYT